MALLAKRQLTFFFVLAIYSRGSGAITIDMNVIFEQIKQIRFQNTNAKDVVFNDDILFQLPARSRLDCAQQCAFYDRSCMTFTFTKMSPLGSCRGHKSLMSPKVNTWTKALNSNSFAVAEELNAGCGPPPSVTLATPLTTGQERVWDTVTYSCKAKGVLMDGPPDVMCQSDHTWTAPTFSCINCKNNSGHNTVSIHGNNGTLTSPGYPGRYASSMDCVYIVALDQPGPQTVTVSMQYNLERCGSCWCDYIQLNNNTEKFCGSGSVNKTFTVHGQSWNLRLRTDHSDGRQRGFLMHYQTDGSG